MKTLYININGENIQSAEDIIVVGRPKDAIINKFFFEFGKEILKGVVAPGITSIKKEGIVTAFKTHDEKSFNLIMEQWDILKQELLGEKPTGIRTINLPDEYISWLQNSSQPAYVEIAKSLYQRGGSVEISLDKIYKNAIGIIVNNIDPEECKDCGLFVVNDDAVTDDSAITAAIQERMPQIAFVPFEDFGNCPKCGKKKCECETKPSGGSSKAPECTKCEESLCVFKKARGNYINENQNILLEKESESDKEWSSDEVKKLEKFFPQYKGGLDYIGKSGEDYLLYGYTNELRECNNADIVTSQGKILFALNREDGIVVIKVLPSGLLLTEKCEKDDTSFYGIVCKHGKILIPCEKGKHRNITNKNIYELQRWGRVFEKSPGVIKFPDEKYYIDAYTREQYVDVVGDYGLKIKSDNNDSLIDVVNIKTAGVIAKDVTIDNEPGLREIINGWYLVHVLKRNGKGRVDKVSMIFNEEKILFLDEMETIYGNFINNDRIITRKTSEIRIRDYNGNIIKVITTPNLYFTDPYKYGKLAAFILGENDMAKSLVYFDMQGEEHRISFNVEHFHYSNLRAYFTSETELYFNNWKSPKRSCLLNIIESAE